MDERAKSFLYEQLYEISSINLENNSVTLISPDEFNAMSAEEAFKYVFYYRDSIAKSSKFSRDNKSSEIPIIDIPDIDLSGVDLSGIRISYFSLSNGPDGRGRYTSANVSSVNLTGTNAEIDLNPGSVVCNIEENLSNVQRVETIDFSRSHFDGCEVFGILPNEYPQTGNLIGTRMEVIGGDEEHLGEKYITRRREHHLSSDEKNLADRAYKRLLGGQSLSGMKGINSFIDLTDYDFRDVDFHFLLEQRAKELAREKGREEFELLYSYTGSPNVPLGQEDERRFVKGSSTDMFFYIGDVELARENFSILIDATKRDVVNGLAEGEYVQFMEEHFSDLPHDVQADFLNQMINKGNIDFVRENIKLCKDPSVALDIYKLVGDIGLIADVWETWPVALKDDFVNGIQSDEEIQFTCSHLHECSKDLQPKVLYEKLASKIKDGEIEGIKNFLGTKTEYYMRYVWHDEPYRNRYGVMCSGYRTNEIIYTYEYSNMINKIFEYFCNNYENLNETQRDNYRGLIISCAPEMMNKEMIDKFMKSKLLISGNAFLHLQGENSKLFEKISKRRQKEYVRQKMNDLLNNYESMEDDEKNKIRTFIFSNISSIQDNEECKKMLADERMYAGYKDDFSLKEILYAGSKDQVAELICDNLFKYADMEYLKGQIDDVFYKSWEYIYNTKLTNKVEKACSDFIVRAHSENRSDLVSQKIWSNAKKSIKRKITTERYESGDIEFAKMNVFMLTEKNFHQLLIDAVDKKDYDFVFGTMERLNYGYQYTKENGENVFVGEDLIRRIYDVIDTMPNSEEAVDLNSRMTELFSRMDEKGFSKLKKSIENTRTKVRVVNLFEKERTIRVGAKNCISVEGKTLYEEIIKLNSDENPGKRLEFIHDLISSGSDVNYINYTNKNDNPIYSPTLYAALNITSDEIRKDVVKKLIEAGVDVNAVYKNVDYSHGTSPIASKVICSKMPQFIEIVNEERGGDKNSHSEEQTMENSKNQNVSSSISVDGFFSSLSLTDSQIRRLKERVPRISSMPYEGELEVKKMILDKYGVTKDIFSLDDSDRESSLKKQNIINLDVSILYAKQQFYEKYGQQLGIKLDAKNVIPLFGNQYMFFVERFVKNVYPQGNMSKQEYYTFVRGKLMDEFPLPKTREELEKNLFAEQNIDMG
ncbi:MAG: hypothetical protein IJX99_09495 [Clostridia bacterium]|nr:hypothetical protein [Clostridia bacterium]